MLVLLFNRVTQECCMRVLILCFLCFGNKAAKFKFDTTLHGKVFIELRNAAWYYRNMTDSILKCQMMQKDIIIFSLKNIGLYIDKFWWWNQSSKHCFREQLWIQGNKRWALRKAFFPNETHNRIFAPLNLQKLKLQVKRYWFPHK